jgi:hypothetical protein
VTIGVAANGTAGDFTLPLPLPATRRALDDGLGCASRSRPAPFVTLARPS